MQTCCQSSQPPAPRSQAGDLGPAPGARGPAPAPPSRPGLGGANGRKPATSPVGPHVTLQSGGSCGGHGGRLSAALGGPWGSAPPRPPAGSAPRLLLAGFAVHSGGGASRAAPRCAQAGGAREAQAPSRRGRARQSRPQVVTDPAAADPPKTQRPRRNPGPRWGQSPGGRGPGLGCPLPQPASNRSTAAQAAPERGRPPCHPQPGPLARPGGSRLP